MKISSPELKSIILNLITFEDEVDAEENRKRRQYFPKAFLKGTSEVKTKLIGAMERGVISKDISEEELKKLLITDLQWISMKDSIPADKKFIAERHTNAEVELSESAIKAIKHYYEEREELPEMSEEVIDALEELVGDKKVA